MLDGRPIPVFGDGSTRRDYTFVDDIVAGIRGAMDYRRSQFEVVNLGNNRTVSLTEMIRGLEGRSACKARASTGSGAARRRAADLGDRREGATACSRYEAKTRILDGVMKFADWLDGVLLRSLV